jgi:hypothetical protein
MMMKLDEYDPGRETWQAHIDAWMDGELSQRSYCELNGLCPTTFYRWRARLKDEAKVRERRAVARRWRRAKAEESTTPSRGRIRRAR